MSSHRGFTVATVWLTALLALSSTCEAAVRVHRPISEQLPTIARYGQPYQWSFATNTFIDTNSTVPLEYDVTGLPPWAVFEQASLSISGTPPADSANSSRTNTTVTLSAENPATKSVASTTYQLITMPAQAQSSTSRLHNSYPTSPRSEQGPSCLLAHSSYL